MFAAGSPDASVKLVFGGMELLDIPLAAAASSDGPSTLGSCGVTVTNKATIAVNVELPLKTIDVKQRGKVAITLDVEAADTIDNVHLWYI